MERIERILDLAAARGVAVTIAINLLPEAPPVEAEPSSKGRGRSTEGLTAAGVKALHAIASNTIDPTVHSVRSLAVTLDLPPHRLYRDRRFREIFAQYQSHDPTRGHYDDRTGEINAEF